METRQEENDGLILMAALQRLTFACEEDAARCKVAHFERGRGASEGRFSAPVSTATIQKVTKLGVPMKMRRLAWREMFGLNGMANRSDQTSLVLSAALSSPNISRPASLRKQLAAAFLRPVFCLIN